MTSQRTFWQSADAWITPTALFLLIYCVTLAPLTFLVPRGPGLVHHFTGLIAAAVATLIASRFRPNPSPLGLRLAPAKAAAECGRGVLLAMTILFSVQAGMLIFTPLGQDVGLGIVGAELAMLLPASVHEELLFRGYLFQRAASRYPWTTILAGAFLFAAVHAGNSAVGPVALLNIAIAGILLGIACVVSRNLWYPIAIHAAWNLLCGPVLGHEISGYVPRGSLLILDDPGPELLTGGAFGLEASILTTIAELVAIAWLITRKGSVGSYAEREERALEEPITEAVSD